MNKIQQRAISGILSFSMIVSTMPSAFARNESISGTAEISFAASKYVVSENEKKLKVKIVRSGGNDSKVDIAFKAADFTAEYGVDYVVLDENGDELPVADGIVPDESMFEEISNNAITTEVDENAAATDNQTIEESEQSNQNAEDDTTAGEIINDEGKVEKLPSVIEDISDAKPQERIDDAEKQSTDKLESEDDSTQQMNKRMKNPSSRVKVRIPRQMKTVVMRVWTMSLRSQMKILEMIPRKIMKTVIMRVRTLSLKSRKKIIQMQKNRTRCLMLWKMSQLWVLKKQ